VARSFFGFGFRWIIRNSFQIDGRVGAGSGGTLREALKNSHVYVVIG
jgi:hypothetical protein